MCCDRGEEVEEVKNDELMGTGSSAQRQKGIERLLVHIRF